MLDRNELEGISVFKRLSLGNTEKDYLQNVILYNLYSIVGRELMFKGGTCLYKVHGLNRFSEDLDFSMSRYFDFEKVLNKVIYLAAQIGLYTRIKTFDKYQNQLNINLEFKGPLYSGNPRSMCFIGLDISTREKPFLEAEMHAIPPFYRDVPQFDVFSMNLNEMLLEKMAAIYNRKKARDVYDFWFLLKKNIPINFPLLQQKLKKHKIVFDKKIFARKLEEKESAWTTDLKPLISGELPSFAQVKKEIEERL